MGKEMFYVQSATDKLWWAKVDNGRAKIPTISTDTSPLYTTTELKHGYFGIYPTKEEALNAALDKYINGETK